MRRISSFFAWSGAPACFVSQSSFCANRAGTPVSARTARLRPHPPRPAAGHAAAPCRATPLAPPVWVVPNKALSQPSLSLSLMVPDKVLSLSLSLSPPPRELAKLLTRATQPVPVARSPAGLPELTSMSVRILAIDSESSESRCSTSSDVAAYRRSGAVIPPPARTL